MVVLILQFLFLLEFSLAKCLYVHIANIHAGPKGEKEWTKKWADVID